MFTLCEQSTSFTNLYNWS